MTVGYYSPLPPARTGVADYAARLLTELRRNGTVEIAPKRCAVPLYHTGNNPLHAAIYQRAIEQPGIVVLHDAVLHHFLLGQLSEKAYLDEFVYNYGEWNRGLAADLWKGRASSGSDGRYFQYPMLRRLAERSLGVVVHNPAAARAIREHAPQAKVVEIPHLFARPSLPSPAKVHRYRGRLGLGPEIFVFGIFGYLRESKRLVTALQVFQAIHRDLPRTALVVAGQFVSRDLEHAAEPWLHSPGVIRLPYLGEQAFWLAASAVDACINLRYPTAGETSGIAIRLMGIGKPVMMTDSLECSQFPEDGALRIPVGVAERDSLRQHMLLLTSISDMAGAIGQRAARHIHARHGVEGCAAAYWKLLCESAS